MILLHIPAYKYRSSDSTNNNENNSTTATTKTEHFQQRAVQNISQNTPKILEMRIQPSTQTCKVLVFVSLLFAENNRYI